VIIVGLIIFVPFISSVNPVEIPGLSRKVLVLPKITGLAHYDSLFLKLLLILFQIVVAPFILIASVGNFPSDGFW
jgi:hypothetical protein